MCEQTCAQCTILQKELTEAKALLKEWGIGVGKPIMIRMAKTPKKHVTAKDSIVCSWNSDTKITTEKVDSVYVDTNKYRNKMTAQVPPNITIIDTVAVYSFSDALGFTNAVAGVFGESSQDKTI